MGGSLQSAAALCTMMFHHSERSGVRNAYDTWENLPHSHDIITLSRLINEACRLQQMTVPLKGKETQLSQNVT